MIASDKNFYLEATKDKKTGTKCGKWDILHFNLIYFISVYNLHSKKRLKVKPFTNKLCLLTQIFMVFPGQHINSGLSSAGDCIYL